jgi:hypothetical protein
MVNKFRIRHAVLGKLVVFAKLRGFKMTAKNKFKLFQILLIVFAVVLLFNTKGL